MDFFGLLFIVIAVWLYNKVQGRLSDIEKQVGSPAEGLRVSQLEERIDNVEGWMRQIGSEPMATAEPSPDALAKSPVSIDDQIDGPGEVATASVTESEHVSPPDTDVPVIVTDPHFHPDLIVQSLSTPPRAVRHPTSVAAGSRVAEPPARPPSPVQERWNRVETQVIENWTGILGAAVLVAGITFIGGYTGLRMSPFYRSLMIVGAAATLAAGPGESRRRPRNWPIPYRSCCRHGLCYPRGHRVAGA